MKLALILSVTTVDVEHVLCTIKYMKSQLCNKMGNR